MSQPQMIYSTDAMCTYSWAFEPIWTRLQAQYGRFFATRIRMGGLLPWWDGVSSFDEGIESAQDLHDHMVDVGAEYDMPVSGEIWLHDSIRSSYPAARVYLLLREQSPILAAGFLRMAREAAMMFDRRIDLLPVLTDLLNGLHQTALPGAAELQPEVLAEASFEAPAARLLEADERWCAAQDAETLPTITLIGTDGTKRQVLGVRPYAEYAAAIHDVLGASPEPDPLPTLEQLLERPGHLLEREIEIIYGLPPDQVDPFVRQELAGQSWQWRMLSDLNASLGSYRYLITDASNPDA